MYEQLKLENQVCFRLYTASRLITQAYRPLLEPLGLTYPQYLVLMVLWEEDVQTVSAISERLFLESNTITPLLQRMEKEGLVERKKGTVDGRQTVVSLTRKGARLEEKAKEVPSCLTHTLNNRGLCMEDAQALVKGLDTIIKIMKKDD